MQIVAVVDLSHWQDHALRFAVTCQTTEAEVTLVLPALAVGNGVQVTELQVEDAHGGLIPYTVAQEVVRVQATQFRLTYTLHTAYTDCVGCDKAHDFIYPFINAHAIFFGSGTLPCPATLAAAPEAVQFSFQLQGLPAGWHWFSNILAPAHAILLDGFFGYCAPQPPPQALVYAAAQFPVQFRWLAQVGKTFPPAIENLQPFVEFYLPVLERHLGPLRLSSINFLLLQAPPDFEQLTQGRSFATGENLLNGIVAYGPNAAPYLQALTGTADYARFLLEGLAHELLHFYTTTSWHGRYKSRLYPAPTCPRPHALLIGEALNVYFCKQWVAAYLGEAEAFMGQRLSAALHQHRQTQRRSLWLDLFLFDIALQRQGGTLLSVFRDLVRWATETAQPYASGHILLEAAERLGYRLPTEYPARLLGDTVPDYLPLTQQALDDLGYTLSLLPDEQVCIEQSHPARLVYRMMG